VEILWRLDTSNWSCHRMLGLNSQHVKLRGCN
jgi:hypothetical protein